MATRPAPGAPAGSAARLRHRLTARRVFAWSHRWAGALAALFLLWIALTGAALAWASELFRWQYGAMLDGGRVAGSIDIDRIVAAAGSVGPLEPNGIFMPHSRLEVDAALLYGTVPGKQGLEAVRLVAVDPATGRYQGWFDLADAWGHDLIDLHYELAMGPAGAVVSTILGLLVAAFAFTGLYLWWPRGRMGVIGKAARLDWRGTPLRKMFRLHGLAGVWMLLPAVFFAVTGSALAKPDWFGRALDDLPHSPPAAVAPAFTRTCAGVVSPGQAARAAEAALPGRRVAMLEFPHDGQAYRIGLKGSSDWDAIEGDAVAFVHPTCRGVVWTEAARDASAPAKLGHALYGLHSGRAFGAIGDMLVLVAGLALALLSGTGLYVWAVKLFGPRRHAVAPRKPPVS